MSLFVILCHNLWEKVDLNEAHVCELNLIVVNDTFLKLIVGSESIRALSGHLDELVR